MFALKQQSHATRLVEKQICLSANIISSIPYVQQELEKEELTEKDRQVSKTNNLGKPSKFFALYDAKILDLMNKWRLEKDETASPAWSLFDEHSYLHTAGTTNFPIPHQGTELYNDMVYLLTQE